MSLLIPMAIMLLGRNGTKVGDEQEWAKLLIRKKFVNLAIVLITLIFVIALAIFSEINNLSIKVLCTFGILIADGCLIWHHQWINAESMIATINNNHRGKFACYVGIVEIYSQFIKCFINNFENCSYDCLIQGKRKDHAHDEANW